MRLLVDLQGLQNASSRSRGIGRYVRSMARAIARNSGEHQVHFLLNGLFQDQIDDVISSFGDVAKPEQFHVFSMPGPTDALRLENGWRRAAAHTLYEAVVHDLAPEALLFGSLFEGGNGDSVGGVMLQL